MAKSRGEGEDGDGFERVAKQQALSVAPSEAQAKEFAKLLRSGVPQYDSLCYLLGPLTLDEAAGVLQRWMRSAVVRDALAALNGGAWTTLSAEARIDTALDKHKAEMAHFLYTNDFEHADGPTLRKMDMARTALEAERTGRMDRESPYAKFLSQLLAGDVAVVKPVRALKAGERPQVLGLADVEPVVEGQVAEAGDEE